MKRPNKKQSLFIGGAVVIVALSVAGAYSYRQGPSIYASAISSDIRHSVDFTLYVPRQLPSGYVLSTTAGVKFVGNVLFMQFTKDDQTIFVSQQKKPHPAPALATLKDFTPLNVPIGQAVVGEQDGSAAAIVLTNDSLITVAGDGTVASSDLGLVAKRLEAVR